MPDGKVCNRFLGRFNGQYEVKCPRCKGIKSNLDKPYDKTKGDHQ